MFHQKLSMLAAAAAAALAVSPSLSQAVELGDLKVVSQPGQPLEAVLDVNDVDITISPLWCAWRRQPLICVKAWSGPVKRRI